MASHFWQHSRAAGKSFDQDVQSDELPQCFRLGFHIDGGTFPVDGQDSLEGGDGLVELVLRRQFFVLLPEAGAFLPALLTGARVPGCEGSAARRLEIPAAHAARIVKALRIFPKEGAAGLHAVGQGIGRMVIPLFLATDWHDQGPPRGQQISILTIVAGDIQTCHDCRA